VIMANIDLPDGLSIMSLGLEILDALLSHMGCTHDLGDKWI